MHLSAPTIYLELWGYPWKLWLRRITYSGPVPQIPHSYTLSSNLWSASLHTVVILKPPGKCGSGKYPGLRYRPEFSFSCNQMLESIRLPWEPQLPLIFPVPFWFQIYATDTPWSTSYVPRESSQTLADRKYLASVLNIHFIPSPECLIQ